MEHSEVLTVVSKTEVEDLLLHLGVDTAPARHREQSSRRRPTERQSSPPSLRESPAQKQSSIAEAFRALSSQVATLAARMDKVESSESETPTSTPVPTGNQQRSGRMWADRPIDETVDYSMEIDW